MNAITAAGSLARRPMLDPADWKLQGLSVWHHNDLLEFRSPCRTSMEAELLPLTDAAIAMIPGLAGHGFVAQGKLFRVTWAQLNCERDTLVTVSIRCEESWDCGRDPLLLEQSQPLLP